MVFELIEKSKQKLVTTAKCIRNPSTWSKIHATKYVFPKITVSVPM